MRVVPQPPMTVKTALAVVWCRRETKPAGSRCTWMATVFMAGEPSSICRAAVPQAGASVAASSRRTESSQRKASGLTSACCCTGSKRSGWRSKNIGSSRCTSGTSSTSTQKHSSGPMASCECQFQLGVSSTSPGRISTRVPLTTV